MQGTVQVLVLAVLGTVQVLVLAVLGTVQVLVLAVLGTANGPWALLGSIAFASQLVLFAGGR